MHSSDPIHIQKSVGRVAVRLFAFCFPILLTWAGLEWFLKQVPNAHTVKQAALEGLKAEVDTLIVGSSSAYLGISPVNLSGSAFNLANTAQTLEYDVKLVEKLVPQLPSLKRVIVTIGYISLDWQLNDSSERWRQYNYEQFWTIPPSREADRSDVRMWSLVALYSPRSSLKMASEGFPSLAKEVDARGWFQVPVNDVSIDLGQDEAKRKVGSHNALMRVANASANVARLENLFVNLRQRRVEVVLVTLPVWQTYADAMNPERWARTQTTLEKLTDKYGIRYFSFLREPRLEAADFYDLDHLNSRGAIRFTQMLNAALESNTAGACCFSMKHISSHSTATAR